MIHYYAINSFGVCEDRALDVWSKRLYRSKPATLAVINYSFKNPDIKRKFEIDTLEGDDLLEYEYTLKMLSGTFDPNSKADIELMRKFL